MTDIEDRLRRIEERLTRLEERVGPRERELINEWATRKEVEFMRVLRVNLLNPTDKSMCEGERAYAESIAARAIADAAATAGPKPRARP